MNCIKTKKDNDVGLFANVSLDWTTGVLTKRLALDHQTGDVCPFIKFCADKLTHFQEIRLGDVIYSVDYHIHTDKFIPMASRLLSGNRSTKYNRIAPLGKHQALIQHMQKIDRIMFSDFNLFLPLGQLRMTKVNDRKPYEEFLSHLRDVDLEMYDFIIASLDESDVEDLPIDWNGEFNKLPKWLNTRSRLVVDSHGRTVSHTSEHWILYHADGTVEMPDLEPSKGACISAETQRTIKVYGAIPPAIPKSVIRAIRVVLGPHVLDGKTTGVAWTLYR